MAKRKITDELRFLMERVAKLKRMEGTEESIDENVEAFEQSGNEVNGDAFIVSLETDKTSVKNDELPLNGRQQLKELREKFVKMETELKESKQLNIINKLEQQNKELREKIKHCELVAELSVLREKVAKIGEKKQREKEGKEHAKYEKSGETEQQRKQSSSKTKTENDFEAIFGRTGEAEKQPMTKKGRMYGKMIYTSDTWMFESTSAFFQILSDWVIRAKAASADTATDAQIELNEQTFADCQEAIKALGIFSNTDPKVLLRRWRSGYRKRHPEATARVQYGLFMIDGDEVDEQENRTRRQRRQPPAKLVGQRTGQKTLLDRIDELEGQLKSQQQQQQGEERGKYVSVEVFKQMQNDQKELLEKFNTLEKQLKELKQKMANEWAGESVRSSGSANHQHRRNIRHLFSFLLS